MTRTVCFLASLGRPASDFDELAEAVQRAGYRPVALDPREAVPEDTTLADLADDVLARMSATGEDEFHVVGHAFGNRLARMVTARSGSRVASLTLLAAGGLVEMAPEVAHSFVNCFSLEMGTAAHLDAVARAFFAPGNDAAVWTWGWSASIAHYQRRALELTGRSEWWDAVAARVLVIQGLQDVIAVPENGRRYVADHGDVARLVEIDRAGHALIVERPNEVADALVTFLDEVSA